MNTKRCSNPSLHVRGLNWLLISLLFLSATRPLKGQSFDGSTFGGSENDAAFSLCVMPDGGFALAGLTRSEGAGSNDFHVVRLDQTGRQLWSRNFGINVQEQAFWVEPTSDGGLFLTGYSYTHPQGKGRQDFFLVKLDASGDQEWQKFYGSNLLDVGLCGKPVTGGYAALGISREGDTRGNFYFAKLASDGSRLWYRIYDSPYVDYGHEFLELEDGGFMLFGTESGFLFPSELDHAKSNADLMLIRVDSLGNEVWRKIYGGKRHDFGKAIKSAADGGFYLFGSTQNQGAGSFDQYLLKIDANGDTLWSRTYGFPGWDYGNAMDVDPQGNLYLLGTRGLAGPQQKPDIFLVKADPEGNPIWSLELGGDSSEYGMAVRALPEGGCAITGSTKSMGAGAKDIYFAMISADGIPITGGVVVPEDNFAVVVPNPVTGESAIRIPGNMQGDLIEWRAFDTQGKIVLRKRFPSGSTPSLLSSELPQGIYFYELVDRGQMVLKGKFVVY